MLTSLRSHNSYKTTTVWNFSTSIQAASSHLTDVLKERETWDKGVIQGCLTPGRLWLHGFYLLLTFFRKLLLPKQGVDKPVSVWTFHFSVLASSGGPGPPGVTWDGF